MPAAAAAACKMLLGPPPAPCPALRAVRVCAEDGQLAEIAECRLRMQMYVLGLIRKQLAVLLPKQGSQLSI
jgi:hypothetical protein